MMSLITREEMDSIYQKTDQDQVPKCIGVYKDVVNFILGFLSCVLSVQKVLYFHKEFCILLGRESSPRPPAWQAQIEQLIQKLGY